MSANLVAPPDKTMLLYKSLRTSTSHLRMDWKAVSWIPLASPPIKLALTRRCDPRPKRARKCARSELEGQPDNAFHEHWLVEVLRPQVHAAEELAELEVHVDGLLGLVQHFRRREDALTLRIMPSCSALRTGRCCCRMPGKMPMRLLACRHSHKHRGR